MKQEKTIIEADPFPTGTMTMDAVEAVRRERLAELNCGAEREELERNHGQVWDPAELAGAFEVLGFMAPYVVVRRRSDGQKGSLEFQHDPRFYFNWQEDR